MKWYKVNYLIGFGAMSIHEETLYFQAYTKRGARRKFLKHFGGSPPISYQCNYSYDVMRDDIHPIIDKEIKEMLND